MILNTQELAELQSTELEIFKAFISACEKLNIKYYLIGGTLLGAVRHSGFIPWDDDIDVGIPREDYEKFLAEGQKYLPEHLFLQSYFSDPEYPKAYAKIRNSNTAFVETPISHLKMNHGVFIDVFPLDYHDSNQKSIPSHLLANLRTSYAIKKSVLSKKVRLLRWVSKLRFPTLKSALHAIDNAHRKCKKGDSLANYCGIYGEKEIVPTEWFGTGTPIMFEGIEATAPKEYENVLTHIYGDYMTPPPPEKRVTLHATDIIDLKKSYKEYV